MSYDGFVYGVCYTSDSESWLMYINGAFFRASGTAGSIAGLVPLCLPVKKGDKVYISRSLLESRVRYYKPS